jgi:hypothetical protein
MSWLVRAWRWRPATRRHAWAVAAGWTVGVLVAIYGLELIAGWHVGPGFIFCGVAGYLAASALAQPAKLRKRPEQTGQLDQPHQAALQLPGDIPHDVVDLIRQGMKIQAIKRYRQLNHGVGLKEAKDIIDRI